LALKCPKLSSDKDDFDATGKIKIL
jgi:hypothetical protein